MKTFEEEVYFVNIIFSFSQYLDVRAKSGKPGHIYNWVGKLQKF